MRTYALNHASQVGRTRTKSQKQKQIEMRKIVILLTGITILSCNQAKKNDAASKGDKGQIERMRQTEKNFNWLLGEWERLNEEEGNATFENWKKISSTEYAGIGYTMQEGDTIKQENIRLVKSNENWNLIVMVPEETESVTFLGTSHNENEFIAENHEIDLPNRIKYWRDGERLKASVSNAEMEIPFEFKKLDR